MKQLKAWVKEQIEIGMQNLAETDNDQLQTYTAGMIHALEAVKTEISRREALKRTQERSAANG